ncbi:MAG: hypothetical protein GY697_07390, partial [Desulfobacterales bacterium]|nr:hypothetical protein [Desulfobacterales bacterium]
MWPRGNSSSRAKRIARNLKLEITPTSGVHENGLIERNNDLVSGIARSVGVDVQKRCQPRHRGGRGNVGTVGCHVRHIRFRNRATACCDRADLPHRLGKNRHVISRAIHQSCSKGEGSVRGQREIIPAVVLQYQ